jgi:hypothetical protein
MSAENPHALRKIPLHSSKIGAWCTVSRKWNVGALLFEETITEENFPISFTQIVALLKKNELDFCFQKDGERAHIEK